MARVLVMRIRRMMLVMRIVPAHPVMVQAEAAAAAAAAAIQT